MQTQPTPRKPNVILLFGLLGIVAIVIVFTMFARSQGNSSNVKKFLQNMGGNSTTGLVNQATQAGVPRITALDHARGAADPSVVWIEYGDFECPFCKRYHSELQQLLAAYPDDVQVVFRHFPLDAHTNAHEKAVASECAAELGGEEAFWAYHDMLYDRANSSGLGISLEDLPDFAVELGLSREAFESCLVSGRHDGRINSDLTTAQVAGVSGTPTTVIIAPDGTGSFVPGVIEFTQMQEVMDLLLN